MTNGLFSNGDQPNIEIDDNADYLTELVGDGKKFKTPQDLAKGKMYADLMIENLQRENAELREDYMKAVKDGQTGARLDELIDQINRQQLASSEQPLTNEDQPLSQEQIAEIASKIAETKITQAEVTRHQQANYNAVLAKLKERYGNNYGRVLSEQRDELGLDETFVENLARTSPNAFFRTFGLDQEQVGERFQAPPASNRRSDGFAPRTEKRTWSYYQKMRKENPTQYHTAKTQLQMQRDALELGDDFTDGDFYAAR